MARIGKAEAVKAANMLADKLEELKSVAILTNAGDDNDGASTINEVVRDRINVPAASALREPLAEAQELASNAPTLDQGEGTGPLHPDFLNQLAERGFPAQPGASGENLSVPIEIEPDGFGETLDVNLLSSSD